MEAQLILQKFLRERYEAIRAKNRAYSIRAFAKQAGVSPATLSRILNGRRKVSRKLVDEISRKLMLDPMERAQLLEHFPEKITYSKSSNKIDEADTKMALQLTADQYQVVADWRAYAILGLTEIKGFKNDPQWIAERIGSSVGDVKQLLARLMRLEMIADDGEGGLQRTHARYRTTDDIANLSLRKSHYQNLELAKDSLDNDSVDSRDFTWMTLPIDPEQIPEAKTLIRKFENEFLKILSAYDKPTEVYRLAVQFFPLTKNKSQGAKI